MRRQSFERFYLEKVAVGEGCGCAEQAIGMRDMDARSRQLASRRQTSPFLTTLGMWFRDLGRLLPPWSKQ